MTSETIEQTARSTRFKMLQNRIDGCTDDHEESFIVEAIHQHADPLLAEINEAGAWIQQKPYESLVVAAKAIRDERDELKAKLEASETASKDFSDLLCKSTVSVKYLKDLLESSEKAAAEMRDVIQRVRDHTNADDEKSYRCDDREGCLDTVFAIADKAIKSNAGLEYVHKSEVEALKSILPPDALTLDKAKFIMKRDLMTVTGFVLTSQSGNVGIIDSAAVRWLSRHEMWWLMHESESPLSGDEKHIRELENDLKKGKK